MGDITKYKCLGPNPESESLELNPGYAHFVNNFRGGGDSTVYP